MSDIGSIDADVHDVGSLLPLVVEILRSSSLGREAIEEAIRILSNGGSISRIQDISTILFAILVELDQKMGRDRLLELLERAKDLI